MTTWDEARAVHETTKLRVDAWMQAIARELQKRDCPPPTHWNTSSFSWVVTVDDRTIAPSLTLMHTVGEFDHGWVHFDVPNLLTVRPQRMLDMPPEQFSEDFQLVFDLFVRVLKGVIASTTKPTVKRMVLTVKSVGRSEWKDLSDRPFDISLENVRASTSDRTCEGRPDPELPSDALENP